MNLAVESAELGQGFAVNYCIIASWYNKVVILLPLKQISRQLSNLAGNKICIYIKLVNLSKEVLHQTPCVMCVSILCSDHCTLVFKLNLLSSDKEDLRALRSVIINAKKCPCPRCICVIHNALNPALEI